MPEEGLVVDNSVRGMYVLGLRERVNKEFAICLGMSGNGCLMKGQPKEWLNSQRMVRPIAMMRTVIRRSVSTLLAEAGGVVGLGILPQGPVLTLLESGYIYSWDLDPRFILDSP